MDTEIIERWQFKSARTLGGSGGKRSNSATSPRSVGLLLALLRGAKVSRGRVETCGVIGESGPSCTGSLGLEQGHVFCAPIHCS